MDFDDWNPEMDCAWEPPTAAQIEEYQSEQDQGKRIELAYLYHICTEDLYKDDLEIILDDQFSALLECEEELRLRHDPQS